ncbi:MAG: hypothetical protein BMS9Abin36_1454 [Gammaproteobacteria bacterium]|nr:MAG: hypothetical protein BMS9Abin36_1454 [Gammaproteobacteria bacterium]
MSDSSSNSQSGLISRLGDKLSATRRSLGHSLGNALLGNKALDEDILEELETILITADVGLEATQSIVHEVTDQIARKELKDSDAVYSLVREKILAMLQPCAVPLAIDTREQPFVIMVVGVNGVGKTTTIGKLAQRLKQQGYKVMLAAGDTFRAAAVEQLQAWGERNEIPVIAQATGADSASVAHDAMEAARARGSDVLIIDTAGRQHTHDGLMQELEKIKRVIGKQGANAPHEVMLVLDGGTGQNALSQLDHFNRVVNVTGISLTKLDGTAKGGILIAIANNTNIPIRFIGVGEGIDDLRPFDASDFTEALFS